MNKNLIYCACFLLSGMQALLAEPKEQSFSMSQAEVYERDAQGNTLQEKTSHKEVDENGKMVWHEDNDTGPIFGHEEPVEGTEGAKEPEPTEADANSEKT